MNIDKQLYRDCVGFVSFPNFGQPVEWPRYMMLSGGPELADPTSCLSGIFLSLSSAMVASPTKEIVALAVPSAITFLRSLALGRQLTISNDFNQQHVDEAIETYGGATPSLVEAHWPLLGFTVADCWLGTSQWFFNASYQEFEIELNESGLLNDDSDAHMVRTIMDYTSPYDSPHYVIAMYLVQRAAKNERER
ncbi:MAG: hypothetical protein K8R88_03780 [Armatimonadetes bacterium]|nr:hypothetical protein [Armatimonadota bacterium]